MTYLNKITTQFIDAATDAFDRQRVSQPVTLFDAKQLFDKNEFLYSEETNGSATSVHTPADSSTVMSVSSNNDYVIRQTYSRFNYSPGKSQLILMTGTFGATTASTEKRIGYFNSDSTGDFDTGYDGLYFEDNGTNLGVCVAKSGSVTRIAQSSWNIDPMDGTGPSGVTLDLTKSHIFVIDFEWLGVGRIRFGIGMEGSVMYVHEVFNSNVNAGVYMSSPNHSVRYEIRSTGGSSSLEHICSSVESEGGFDPKGIVLSYDTGSQTADAFDINTDVAVPVLGFRLQDDKLDSVIKLLDLSILVSSGANARWELYLNPTINLNGETFTYADVGNSTVQIAEVSKSNPIAARITGGTLIDSGWISNNSDAAQKIIESVRSIGAAIDGTRDEYVICLNGVGSTSSEDYFVSVTWQETL